MLIHFQNYIALLGADHVGNVAGLHGESLVFELLGKRTTFEESEIAALGRSGTVGIFFGNVRKTRALANLLQHIVCLGLSGREGSGFVVVAGGGRRRAGAGLIRRGLILGVGRLRGRNQDFAELDGFRLFHLAFVLVVELLLFFLGNGQVRAYFFANHLLRNDLVAQ